MRYKYFLCIIWMWSLFCSVRVYISLHFFTYSFWKLGFLLAVFWFLCFYIFGFWLLFFVLYFEFNDILNNLRLKNILQFLSHLFKWSVKMQKVCHAIYKKKLFCLFLKKNLENVQNQNKFRKNVIRNLRSITCFIF